MAEKSWAVSDKFWEKVSSKRVINRKKPIVLKLAQVSQEKYGKDNQ